jgi:hypothetical protein
MKLFLRIIMAFCLTLMLNTISYGASYSTAIGEPNEETVAKENFKSKAKDFLQKRVFKKVKNRFKDIKDTWNSYKEAKKMGTIGLFTIFLLLATIALVVLKILEIILWNWIWVFAPLWIPIALAILIFIVVFFVFLIIKGKS